MTCIIILAPRDARRYAVRVVISGRRLQEMAEEGIYIQVREKEYIVRAEALCIIEA